MVQRVKPVQHDLCLIPRAHTVEGHTSCHKTALTSMHMHIKNKTRKLGSAGARL